MAAEKTEFVLQPFDFVEALGRPRLEAVADTGGPSIQVTAASTLRLTGGDLRGDDTRVFVGGLDVTTPVGLGLADKGEAGRAAVETALALEAVGEVLAAVVVAQFDAAGGAGGAGAEDVHERLGDGFICGETVPAFADMVAETLGVPVLRWS